MKAKEFKKKVKKLVNDPNFIKLNKIIYKTLGTVTTAPKDIE